MGIHVLLVEDDETFGQGLVQALANAFYVVTWVRSGEEGFFLAATQRFDLMVLDVSLPGRSGLEVLTALRLKDKTLPVMIVSARGEVEERVMGLRAGADDFLTKPCSFDELEARLQALLRRGRPDILLRLAVHDLTMDLAKRLVVRADRALATTHLEFELLALLMRRAHTVVSRDTLACEVWKQVRRATPIDNLIDVHISRLRRKVDLPALHPLIHTIRGLGFILTDKAP